MSTVDRTRHVLDAIDGALEDWSVSADAMRWSPEPEVEPRPSGPSWRPTLVPPEIAVDWSPRQNGRASWHNPAAPIHHVAWPAAIEAWDEALRRAMETVGQPFAQERIAEFAATLADLQPPPTTDDAEPEAARARALRMRQQRGTGPAREPAGRQKRPRQL